MLQVAHLNTTVLTHNKGLLSHNLSRARSHIYRVLFKGWKRSELIRPAPFRPVPSVQSDKTGPNLSETKAVYQEAAVITCCLIHNIVWWCKIAGDMASGRMSEFGNSYLDTWQTAFASNQEFQNWALVQWKNVSWIFHFWQITKEGEKKQKPLKWLQQPIEACLSDDL